MTKVFPDEYHLHTLDLLLSAIARLNPHVDMKKIVIGLMDRLSSYAARDSDNNNTPEKKKQSEEEATARLLEKLRLAKENEAAKPVTNVEVSGEDKDDTTTESNKEPDATENGEQEHSPVANGEEDVGSKSKLPVAIKLYEIFFEQVVSLVRTRNLPIQDTVALSVSLVNLAL